MILVHPVGDRSQEAASEHGKEDFEDRTLFVGGWDELLQS